MASEKGPVATEAPLVTPSAPQSSSLAPTAPLDGPAADAGRATSLKRPREPSPTSPKATPAGLVAQPELSPNKFARLFESTRYTPGAPLTGQTALEDERRRKDEEGRLHPPDAVSENPAQRALSALRAQEEMSRKDDAPQTAQPPVEGATKAIDPVVVPPPTAAGADSQSGVSPNSATSAHSLGSGGHVVHSPAPMEVDSHGDRPSYALQPEAQMEEKQTAMSYPGVLPPGGQMPAPAAPARGMSMPDAASAQNPDLAPLTPSSKKHKCPYCETEFTRHHNLKSHLLTHSQEKPYACQDCPLRFRRLHDLKRHSKLHTGEKPHICPKCDRKFARGDALARHSKGAGGCAGRRTSMGSFGGDDDYEEGNATGADDSAMTGVIYDSSEAGMTEEERRRLSLPSIKAQHVSGDQTAPDGYGPHSRTYPPAGPRPGQPGGLYPPNLDQRGPPAGSNTSPSAGAGHTPNTSVSSVPLSGGSASMYSHGMTESPKPLSPSGLQANQVGHGSDNRPRSPSLTQLQQQQQFGRRQADVPAHTASQGPSPLASSAQHGLPGIHSRTPSGPSQAQSGGSGDSSANLFSSEHGLWAYIQTLEERLRQQDDRERQRDDQLKQQADRIASLETTKQGLEAQMAYLTSEVNGLRNGQQAQAAAAAAAAVAAPVAPAPAAAPPAPAPPRPQHEAGPELAAKN